MLSYNEVCNEKFIQKMKDRYSFYKENETHVWIALSQYCRPNGSKYGCYITDFFEEKNIDFSQLVDNAKYTIDGLWKETDNLAKEYVGWVCKTNDIQYLITKKQNDANAKTQDSKLEVENKVKAHIANHLKGWFGEWFFCFILNNYGRNLELNEKLDSSVIDKYTFSNVTPMFDANEKGDIVPGVDMGTDLVGVVSHKDKTTSCVFQCKWWNPKSELINDQKKTYDLASKLNSSGTNDENIENIKDVKNMFICWTRSSKDVSISLKTYPMVERLGFIDYKVLKRVSTNREFWDSMVDKLNKFK